MKKLINTIGIILCICILLSSCGQEAVVINQPLANKFTTTYSRWGINCEINGSSLTISGILEDESMKYVMATFNDDESLTTTAEVNNGFFTMTVDCNGMDDETVVNLFMNYERYGTYSGLSHDEIILVRTNNGFTFEKAPVYDHNVQIFNNYKNPQDYLSPERDIQSDDIEIIQLAQNITYGINNDYDRIKAVHKWVCENVYYDFDALSTGSYENLDAKNMLIYKKGVCEGYSNLTAALLRSLGIPCRKQSGFGLGISTSGRWDSSTINTTRSNHAWNEAYAEGRWIILDTTWDSQNEYRNGEYIEGEYTTNNYFDSTMEYFSMTHKLF